MRKEKQNQFKEVLDYVEEEMAENMSEVFAKIFKDPKANKWVLGEFSDSEFEWLYRHGSGDDLVPSDRSPTWHRQNKGKALIRTRKAAITLFYASNYNIAFDENEWLAAFPIDALCMILYFATLRGGQDYAYQLAKALNDGLNENLKTTTDGLLKAQVCPQILFSEEKMKEMGSKVLKRAIELTKEKTAKELESAD